MRDWKQAVRGACAGHRGRPFEIGFPDGERARFGDADGAPGFALVFHTETAVARAVLETSLGLGEAYARGDVTVEGDLEDALSTLGGMAHYVRAKPEGILAGLARKWIARSLPREKDDIEHHYGLGDEFYKFYLDRKLQYSCAYFRSAEDGLDLAQEQKIAHTLRKLHLQPGQRLLDVGCGWGHLMLEAAEKYGVSCVGITLCDNQARYIAEQARARNLPVEARVMSYLDLPDAQKWERIVSVGMMCHIGESRIDQYYDKITSLLAPGAVALLHCIAHMEEHSAVDPFVEKHVFPGYWFNSLEGMTLRAVRRGLNVIDVENLRRHYAMTASWWRKNLRRNWKEIQARLGFDDTFLRTWEFYLASVVAGFRTGLLNLIQMVLSNGIQDDYPLTREFLYPAAAGAPGAPTPAAARG